VIFGVGTDVVEIERIEKALGRWGERFARRILCDPELKRFLGHRQPAAYLAKRFAAKEAFTKALGTGIQAPANWHGVWVINQPSGKPDLEFSAPLQSLLSERGISRAHLSLADERGVAVATVILECEK
jgi:holo-[acyl-carrier protein] synthase